MGIIDSDDLDYFAEQKKKREKQQKGKKMKTKEEELEQRVRNLEEVVGTFISWSAQNLGCESANQLITMLDRTAPPDDKAQAT